MSIRTYNCEQRSTEWETWLPVVGCEGTYVVSDLGRVASLDRVDSRGHKRTGKLRVPRTTRSGHHLVNLWRGGSRVTLQVHRLVLEAFVGPCPPGMEACHRNDVPADNRLANLRWGTQSENTRDRVRNGIHSNAKKTHCPSGHPYDEENTHRDPRGKRECRTCRRTQDRIRRPARRAA